MSQLNRWIVGVLICTSIGCSQSTSPTETTKKSDDPKDPKAAFESLIVGMKKRALQPLEYIMTGEDKTLRWRKTFHITGYDITKTDSIVAPLTGLVMFDVQKEIAHHPGQPNESFFPTNGPHSIDVEWGQSNPDEQNRKAKFKYVDGEWQPFDDNANSYSNQWPFRDASPRTYLGRGLYKILSPAD